jgi:uncharacterized protein (DUF4415 family)
MEFEWSEAKRLAVVIERNLPPMKQHINIRIDGDVLNWFEATGKGYQTRINNVLRAYVESRRRA